MQDLPLVSVIIIFLNEERFLAEAVDSVLAQTYAHWELLLVDDGSSDQSSAIAQTYAQQYPEQIRYLEHEGHQNRGMSASRNLGVSQAQGKYIAYLDGDDIWLPQKLGEQVALLQAHPAAVMVHGPLTEWYSWTGRPEDQDRDCLYGVNAQGVHPYADTLVAPPNLLALFLRQEDFIPSGVLVERAVIEQIGGGEEAFRGSFEDAVVHVKLCLRHNVYVSSQSWYWYRIHPDSWERRSIRAGKVHHNRLMYLNWVQSYLTEQQVQDPQVWQALNHALWPYRHPRLHQGLERLRSLARRLKQLIKQVGRQTLSPSVRRWCRDRWRAGQFSLRGGG